MPRNHKHIKMYIADEKTAFQVETIKERTGLSSSKFMQKLFSKYGVIMAAEIAHQNKTGERIDIDVILDLIAQREHDIFAPTLTKKSKRLKRK